MESIIKSLSFDWRFFLAQIVLFIVLTVVLNQVFWKPMLAHLARRDKSINDAYKTVEDTRHEMETLRADYQSRIVKIESEARTHIQQAIKEAQTERERILAEARARADAALQEGIAAMELEKAEAFTSLRERMIAIALSSVEKALGSAVDPRTLRNSIEARITARS
jgi:F-type H+-transporting ATPase subunit b